MELRAIFENKRATIFLLTILLIIQYTLGNADAIMANKIGVQTSVFPSLIGFLSFVVIFAGTLYYNNQLISFGQFKQTIKPLEKIVRYSSLFFSLYMLAVSLALFNSYWFVVNTFVLSFIATWISGMLVLFLCLLFKRMML